MTSRESIATIERDNVPPILSPKEIVRAVGKVLSLEARPADEEDDSKDLRDLPPEDLSVPGKRRYSNK